MSIDIEGWFVCYKVFDKKTSYPIQKIPKETRKSQAGDIWQYGPYYDMEKCFDLKSRGYDLKSILGKL